MQAARAWGALLVGISVLAVVDTVRAIALSEYGWKRYSHHEMLTGPNHTMMAGRNFEFAGHHVALEDDQPTDSVSGQRETPGMLRITIDGRDVGSPSRAGVRRGLPDQGRYHSWFAATVFTSRASGDSSLWLARRVQTGAGGTQYELTELRSDGSIRTRVLRGWQLGFDYRAYEATGLLTWDTFWPLPFELSFVLFLPSLALIYPIGTLLTGIILCLRPRTPLRRQTVA